MFPQAFPSVARLLAHTEMRIRRVPEEEKPGASSNPCQFWFCSSVARQLTPSKVKTSSSCAFAAVLKVTAPDPPPVTFHAVQDPAVPSVKVTPPPTESWLMMSSYCPHTLRPVGEKVVEVEWVA